jgi:Zn-dependent peptidase ImmA (M78 family)
MNARQLTPQKEAQQIVMEYMLEYEGQYPPIPVRDIAKNIFKLSVVNEYLPDEISAVLNVDDSLSSGTILVNVNHVNERQNFSIAHEIGHFVLHRSKGTHIDNDKKTFFRDKRSQEAVYPKEIEANRFAAELLMPSTLINRVLKEFGDDFLDKKIDIVYELAKMFKVSVTAMSLKMQNLGFTL